MKIELRKLSISLALSEETTAFAASVYVNGKLAGDASNDGQGGSTMVRWSDRVLGAQADAYLEAQPPKNYGPAYEGGEDLIVPMNAEVYVDDLVEAELRKKEEKRLRKLCSTKTYFRLAGDPRDSYRVIAAPWGERVRDHVRAKYGDKVVEVLNEKYA